MSKPFEWKDFSKRYNDLSTNNFPTLNNKTNHLENVLKFKFISKAQKGVKLESSVTNKNHDSTESDFSVKLNLEHLKGVELGFKAKSKPGTEFTAKLDDSLIPLEGSSLTFKAQANAPSEQLAGVTFGLLNKYLNLNFSVSLPITHRLFEFLKNEGKDLEEQRTKVELDFVVKPLEDHNVYIGSEVKMQLPKGEDHPFLYTSKVSLGFNNKSTNGGAFVNHEKTHEKGKGQKHETSFGGWLYTEVEDLSGGAKINYNPSKKEDPYKGFSFEILAGLQKDSDSKLSSKVTVIPQTTVSLGFEQKLSSSTKLSFGYAFLLNKVHDQPTSSYNFGIEISH